MRKLCFIFITLWSVVVPAQAQVTITNVSKTTLCIGNQFTVSYTAQTGTYTPTNTFYVELSDPVGGFGSSQIIGSKTGNSNGVINCTVPLSTPHGTAYRVRIRSTDPPTFSNPNSTGLLIQTYPPPIIYSDTSVCAGGPLVLKVLNHLNSQTYSWYNSNNQFIADAREIELIEHPKLIPGKYFVQSVYYGCTSTDTTMYVTVKPRPAKPVVTAEDTICSADTIHLTAHTTTPGVKYEWVGPGGFISFSKDTSILKASMTSQGYYKAVAILLTTGCRSLPDSQFVRVELSPPVNATNNGPLCEGAGLYITANDNTDSMKYSWIGPGGFTMTSDDTGIANAGVSLSGTYILTATLYRCAVIDTTEVLVKPYPEKPVAGSNTPVCRGDQLKLTASSSSSGNYSWKGPFMNFDTTAQNPVIDSVQEHVTGYYVVILDLNGCKRKDSTYVVTKPTPVIPVIISNSPVIKGDTLNIDVTNYSFGITYNWIGPGNFSSVDQKVTIPDVTKDAEGIYTVTATYNVCSSKASVNIQVLAPQDTGVFILYPNPNNGNFTVKGYTLVDQDISIAVSNSIGQMIYTETVSTNNKLLEMHVSLPYTASGVYSLKLKTQGKEHIFRFTAKE